MTVKHFKQTVPRTKIRSIGFTLGHMTTPHTQSKFHRLSHPLLLGMMASLLGILAGVVPDLTVQQPSQIFRIAARADDPNMHRRNPTTAPNEIKPNRQATLAQGQSNEFSDAELRNYAAALMQIEPIRQSTLEQVIHANGGGALPNLVCNQPDTMEALNSEAKSLFIKYCNQSESIASSKGLSIDKFNQITQSVRSNPQLQERVRGFMN